MIFFDIDETLIDQLAGRTEPALIATQTAAILDQHFRFETTSGQRA